MYCNVYYYLYVIIIDIGETLKYLLVGSDEITLETIEVCFISLSLFLFLSSLLPSSSSSFSSSYSFISLHVQINSRSANEVYEIVSLIRYCTCVCI